MLILIWYKFLFWLWWTTLRPSLRWLLFVSGLYWYFHISLYLMICEMKSELFSQCSLNSLHTLPWRSFWSVIFPEKCCWEGLYYKLTAVQALWLFCWQASWFFPKLWQHHFIKTNMFFFLYWYYDAIEGHTECCTIFEMLIPLIGWHLAHTFTAKSLFLHCCLLKHCFT